MIYILYNYYPYIIAGIGYYKILRNTYDYVETGVDMYRTAKLFIPGKKQQEIPSNIIMIKEDQDYLIIDS